MATGSEEEKSKQTSSDRNRQCPGEMTQWRKYLLHRHEDQGLDIQSPYEYWGAGSHSLPVAATLRKHEMVISRESWLEKPAVVVISWLNQESLLQLVIWKVIKKDPQYQPQASACTHTHPHLHNS